MCVITWLAVLQLPRCPVLPAHHWPAGLGQGRAAAEHRQLLSAEGWLRLWLPCSPAGPASHELAGLSLLQQLQGCITSACQLQPAAAASKTAHGPHISPMHLAGGHSRQG